jgi:hypothetical protein
LELADSWERGRARRLTYEIVKAMKKQGSYVDGKRRIPLFIALYCDGGALGNSDNCPWHFSTKVA